jgi:hypothetical protein
MGQTEPTRQSDEILPPIVGSIVCVAVTAAVQVVDLTTMPQTAALPVTTVKGSENLNPLGQYLTMEPDGACSIAFASTAAALAGLVLATTNTISAAGVITPSNATVVALTAGQRVDFRMPPGQSQESSSSFGTGAPTVHGGASPARFLGVLAASNTTLRIWVSSR